VYVITSYMDVKNVGNCVASSKHLGVTGSELSMSVNGSIVVALLSILVRIGFSVERFMIGQNFLR